MIAAVSLYFIDLAVRVYRTRLCEAHVVAIPELRSTRIEIPTIAGGWRAGQHVRLRVLSSHMGWWGWTETHPLTIASASDSGDGLVLLCKNTGVWTRRLYGMASDRQHKDGHSKKVKVMIEGPYGTYSNYYVINSSRLNYCEGGTSNTILASFSALLLVAGGSGITFVLAAVQEIVQKAQDKQTRVKHIHIIWTVQEPGLSFSTIILFKPLTQTLQLPWSLC